MSFESIIRVIFLQLVTTIPLLTTTALPQADRQRVPVLSRQPLTARQIAQRVLPSVVYIEMEGSAGRPACYGSGFFISSTEIITNKHVVTCSDKGRGRVNVAGGKRSYVTTLIVAWPELDVALVEAAGLSAPPLQLGTGPQLSVGDDIFVAGNPAGLEGTFTRGIISGIRSSDNLLQIDAPVSQGSSGGPVVDAYGRVIGITLSSIKEGQNLNFAIPARLLATPLARMRQMLARIRKGEAPPPVTSRAHLPTGPPVKVAPSPTHRAWDARSDWGEFVTEQVGDSTIKDELKALLDSGIDVNARDRSGRTALHLAATLGQAKLAHYLLARGADVNAKDRIGRTPLMLAVGPDDFRLPNSDYAPLGNFWDAPPCGDRGTSKPSQHETSWPMWYVIADHRRPVLNLLLASGADLTPVDNLRRTAFDHAAEGGLTGFERLLRVPGKEGLPPACNLTLTSAPALRGLRLGMSTAEVSARLGGLQPASGRCGLATLSAGGGQLLAPARGFEGIRAVSLMFLDDRVAYINLTYGREFPFASFDEYLAMLSSSLELPRAWRRAAGGPGLERAHVLTCDGFVAAAGHVTYSYVELHDMQAVKTLLQRDVAAAERQRQAERRAQELRKQSFKP